MSGIAVAVISGGLAFDFTSWAESSRAGNARYRALGVHSRTSSSTETTWLRGVDQMVRKSFV